MNRSLFLTTLAAGGIALAMAACDQQEAADNSSVPMQQQGAVPTDNQMTPAPDSGSGTPEAMEPPAGDAGTSEGDDIMPEPDSGNSTQ